MIAGEAAGRLQVLTLFRAPGRPRGAGRRKRFGAAEGTRLAGVTPATRSGTEPRLKTRERTRYHERTPWAPWLNFVYRAAVVLGALSVFWDSRGGAAGMVFATAIVAGGWGLLAVLGGLTVRVEETRVVMHLGSVALLKKTVPFEEIVSLESVSYRPLREFGGWGVRGWGKKKAWTARGDRAVVIGLGEDRRLYVGSDHPERLEEVLRGALADWEKRSG